MKKVILMMTLSPLFAFAKTTDAQTLLVRENLEVKSFISTFEKNRSQKCEEITADDIRVKGDGKTAVRISCNEYDQDGEPQANVHIIEIGGYLYDSSFDLQRVKVTGLE